MCQVLCKDPTHEAEQSLHRAVGIHVWHYSQVWLVTNNQLTLAKAPVEPSIGTRDINFV
jgi:hypothetical protein